MLELSEKYVFHIPLYKVKDNKLVKISIDEILDDLITRFGEGGFDSLYITDVESHYRSRRFDGLILTIFTSGRSPVDIFVEWFEANNHILEQAALAYEHNDKMFIIDLE